MGGRRRCADVLDVQRRETQLDPVGRPVEAVEPEAGYRCVHLRNTPPVADCDHPAVNAPRCADLGGGDVVDDSARDEVDAVDRGVGVVASYLGQQGLYLDGVGAREVSTGLRLDSRALELRQGISDAVHRRVGDPGRRLRTAQSAFDRSPYLCIGRQAKRNHIGSRVILDGGNDLTGRDLRAGLLEATFVAACNALATVELITPDIGFPLFDRSVCEPPRSARPARRKSSGTAPGPEPSPSCGSLGPAAPGATSSGYQKPGDSGAAPVQPPTNTIGRTGRLLAPPTPVRSSLGSPRAKRVQNPECATDAALRQAAPCCQFGELLRVGVADCDHGGNRTTTGDLGRRTAFG